MRNAEQAGSTRVTDLLSRMAQLKVDDPNIRPRDAAQKLGVSEAELLAARIGDGVQRLNGGWGDLIRRMPELGQVMTLTRNESAVHEKVGTFENIRVMGQMCLVLGADIDLRIFFGQWHFGFAVDTPIADGVRRSLQFFGEDGSALLKIFLREEDRLTAYQAVVADHLSDDQSPAIAVTDAPVAKADRPDADIDVEELHRRWAALKDVHDFRAMLMDLGVGRVQALRLVGAEFAEQADVASFRQSLDGAAAGKLPIMIFVGNQGCVQIHTGPVDRLKEMGHWYNVLDPDFNLHLRQDQIASAWVVRKPTTDGIITSLEIYDADDNQIAWMFGERQEGQPENTQWRGLMREMANGKVAA